MSIVRPSHYIREVIKFLPILLFSLLLAKAYHFLESSETRQPNILIALSDDQSWPHAGAYGDTTVSTPAFDRLAQSGVLFTHAFCPASQCSPSRAAFLTGRNIWQLEEAGTHASTFPKKFKVYTDLLEEQGYFVGYTGKPWAPGNWKAGGRPRNPAGREFNSHKLKPPSRFISSTDYAANFQSFLKQRPKGAPFHFWFGCREPHRDYDPGSAVRSGKSMNDLELPSYWPDTHTVRNDFLDYKLEIDWFDQQLARILKILDATGETDNTLIVVTSDNGMPFPRAKATLYESGTRVPLAIHWPEKVPANRTVDDLVSFIDLAPTFLEAAGIEVLPEITGRSLMPMLSSSESGILEPKRDYLLLGKERHNYARPDNVGYPIRGIRTRQYLYLKNLKPDRWPMGDPPYYWCHTKMTNPTKDTIIEGGKASAHDRYFQLSYQKRPGQELYDILEDPECIHNLARAPEYSQIRKQLDQQLSQALRRQQDPRMLGQGDRFESYPYYQRLPERGFPGFMEYGKYNPKFENTN